MSKKKPKVVVSASGVEFTIEKGVPIPPKPTNGDGRKPIYPFLQLAIGDSIFVACDKHKHRNVKACAYNAGRKHGRKFVVRAVADGVRVWRIE